MAEKDCFWIYTFQWNMFLLKEEMKFQKTLYINQQIIVVVVNFSEWWIIVLANFEYIFKKIGRKFDNNEDQSKKYSIAFIVKRRTCSFPRKLLFLMKLFSCEVSILAELILFFMNMKKCVSEGKMNQKLWIIEWSLITCDFLDEYFKIYRFETLSTEFSPKVW